MNSARRSRYSGPFLLRLAGTLLALVLLVYLLSQQGWAEIGAAIRQIPAWRLVLALVITFISRAAVTGRWHVLLRSAGMYISLRDTTRLTFAGLFASNFLPTTVGGDVIRLAGALQLKFDAAISAASLVADRLIGMLGMALALPFGIPSLLEGKFIPPAVGLLFPVILASSTQPPKGFLARLLERGMRLVQNVFAALKSWLHQPRALLAALGLSWVRMLCDFSVIWLLLDGMQQHMPFWQIAGLWSVVYFITLVPVSINGYGVQEVSMAFLYSNIGGVSESSGLTVALLVRTLTILASLPGAAYVPGIMAGQKAQTEFSGENGKS
jgi:uncharacterized membrane protein YbhN (UPF0104 family)